MSALEKTVKATGLEIREKTARESLLSRFVKLLCSVRLGVVLLILLGLACLIGMLIMQQSVDGFSGYYASLTPAQRLVYSEGRHDIGGLSKTITVGILGEGCWLKDGGC